MKNFFVLAALAFLTSCYSKEFHEPGRVSIKKQPTEIEIGSGFEKTWAAVEQVFSKFPIERKEQDKRTSRAFLVTNWVEGKSDLLYSGYDVVRVPYTIRYKLYVYLSGNATRTIIRIKNIEDYKGDIITAGVDFDGSIYTWIRTESSTLKEARLLEEIQKLATDSNFNPSF